MDDRMEAETVQDFRNKADPRRVTRSTMDGAVASGRRLDAEEGNRPMEPLSMLDEMTRRIRGSMVHATLILSRLSALGDRAVGSQPEPGAEATDRVKVSQEGAVDRAFIALNELDTILARLEHAGNRVNELA